MLHDINVFLVEIYDISIDGKSNISYFFFFNLTCLPRFGLLFVFSYFNFIFRFDFSMKRGGGLFFFKNIFHQINNFLRKNYT